MTIKLAVDCAQANDQTGQAPKIANTPELARVTKGPVMTLIAGPCLMESRDHCFRMAEALAMATSGHLVEFYFKASWFKANRTSVYSETHGVGIGPFEAARIFNDIAREFDMACLTDIHEADDAKIFGDACAVLQVPALLSRQTELIRAALNETRVVNIKKGQFMAPHDVRYVVEKAHAYDEEAFVMVTERGHCFGYNNLVVDMRSIPIMKATSGADKVLFDCTHSVQLPSATGLGSSGGQREYIEGLARAAIVSGCDGLFCEVHDDPQNALSDGPCQIPLHHFSDFLKRMLELYEWQRANPVSPLTP